MNKIKKTKILAKIADNRSDVSFIKSLFEAGADVAWLNTAHQDEPSTIDVINKIRSVTTEIPIMIDTKGPEIRTKNVTTPIEVKAGDHIIFTGDSSYSGPNVVNVSYPEFHNEVSIGKSILYDDASIEMVVEEKLSNGIKCIVKSAGLVKNKKSLNVPNVHIKLPALSDKDKSFIHFCAKYNVDFIIHSFVRSKEDIFEIKEITRQYPDYNPKIIAKIENREGFENVQEILENCEGLMVARGDLGAEVPLEELPYMQKKMVESALKHGKYCIVATQVLESMIKNPRPTRAEVTDIANAVLDGTDAISMSGETAYGDYPFEATKLMGRVMAYTESKRDTLIHFTASPAGNTKISQEAHLIIEESKKTNAKAILVNTKDISIVRSISSLRPLIPIYAACITGENQRELRLAYGVFGVKVEDLDVKALAKSAIENVADDSIVLIVEETHGGFMTTTKNFSDLI